MLLTSSNTLNKSLLWASSIKWVTWPDTLTSHPGPMLHCSLSLWVPRGRVRKPMMLKLEAPHLPDSHIFAKFTDIQIFNHSWLRTLFLSTLSNARSCFVFHVLFFKENPPDGINIKTYRGWIYPSPIEIVVRTMASGWRFVSEKCVQSIRCFLGNEWIFLGPTEWKHLIFFQDSI